MVSPKEKVKPNILHLAHIARVAAYSNIPGLGHCDFGRFVVLSQPRSGSNLIVRLLQSHPNIDCFGEVLGDRIYWSKRVGSQHPALYAMRGHDPAGFVERHVWYPHPRAIRAVGFKLLYSQAGFRPASDGRGLVSEGIVERLLALPGLSVINLVRRNSLRKLLSLKKSRITGQDIALKKEDWRDDPPAHLTIGECEAFFRQQEAHAIFIRQKFLASRFMEIFYEDTLRDRQAETDRICGFLGVPKMRLVVGTHRQSHMPLMQRVLNFDELSQHFKETRWSHFFTEAQEAELID